MNTMPDELWAYGKCQDFGIKGHTDEYLSHDSQKHGDGNNDTRYIRADAVEDEMATVKDENIKLKCDVVALELKVKCLKAQRDDHTDLPVVDVEVLYKDTSLQDQNYATCNDIEYGRIEGYNAAIDYLRATYPQGLKWK